MPNLEERLEAVVAQSEVDGSKWHTIVHGDDMTTVQTESGNVPSVAKQLKDVRAEIINGLEDYVGECRQAKADTLQIKSETQTIKGDTNTIKGQTKTLRDEAETFKDLSQTTYNSIASATAASISQVQAEGAVQVALATAQAERALAYAQNAAPTPLGTKLTVPASSKVPDGYEPVWYKNTITRARYVLMLKLYSSEIVTGYLSKVLQRVSSYKDFVSALFQTILNFDHTDSEFSSLYLERKCILKNFAKETEEICEYCKLVSAKGKSGLFYLTDNTNLEKQTVIGLLGRYASELNANDINSILKVVYPDLYSYMGEYNFEHPLLKGYFQAYKYQKLFNHISSDFAKVVEEQAVKREYNSILRPRVSYLEKIDTKNTMVYFVDALGVEYLSFILAQCNSNNLFANVTVCRSELPSITCMNKEFVDVFSSAGCKIIDIKDLDELKHHGTNDFDYQITKEPIHLIEELNIIATVLEKIRTNIASGKCEKAIIISDHGASRLAVINETENKYEMSEKGEHSGRCCPVSDIDEKPDFATEENGYWVLANYDRFKGGRKANVEVHGGAALEEVCVPIIEITPQNEKIDVRLLDSYKNITVSFRKSALIKFFINKKLNNLKVKIEGKYYDAQPTAEEFVYQVSMPDIRKAKNYIFDVYASENMIASGLQFNVKSEVTVEKDLF